MFKKIKQKGYFRKFIVSFIAINLIINLYAPFINYGLAQEATSSGEVLSEATTPTPTPNQPSVTPSVTPTVSPQSATPTPNQLSVTPSSTPAVISQPTPETQLSTSPTVIPNVSTILPSLTPVVASATPTLIPSLEPSSVMSATLRGPITMNKLFKKTFLATETIPVKLTNIDSGDFKITLTHVSGKKITPRIKKEINGDNMTIYIYPSRDLKPGKYKLSVSDSRNKIVEQDFMWGVLAINTNKSIFLPEEQVKFAMTVLDENGKTVCNADLSLKIKSEQALVDDELTTKDGKIITNPDCKIDYTLKNDYEAFYQVGKSGKYNLTLTTNTDNGLYTINDMFEVRDSVAFDIERESVTRIYPPEKYPVNLSITANEDFEGTIEEAVPESFNISKLESDSIKAFDKVEVRSVQNQPDSQDVLGVSIPQLRLPFDGDYPISLRFGEQYQDVNLIEKIMQKFNQKGHDGIDFDMKEETPILSVDDGTVTKAGDGAYGKTVVIKHSWGEISYGHLKEIIVQEGTAVKKGDKIALSGNTGISTGPHLHFAIKPNGADENNGYSGKVDPAPYLGLDNTKVLGISTEEEKVKVITWEASLKKGEKINLGYLFKAPDISPEFYLLGPLTMKQSNNGTIVFQEIRQWQIASDAVIYITTGAINQDTTDPVSVIPVPPTHAAGDILIAAAFNKSGADTITATEGWTEIGEFSDFGFGVSTNWWWKRATAAGTAGPTITSDTGDVYAVVHVVRGVTKTGTPYEDATVRGNTTPETTPDSSLITTTKANTLAVCFLNRNDDHLFTSGWPPALWTNRYELGSSTGTDGGFAVMDRAMATAGDVAEVVIGTWGANEAWGSLTLAFIPEVSPTVALNTPTDTQTISDTTPDLVFTGTDLNADTIEYNVQVDTVSSFDSQGPVVMDKYEESNFNGYTAVYDGFFIKEGQSFTSNGGILDSVKFYLTKYGNPLGTVTAAIYAETHATAFGTDSVGTGSVLATSDTLDVLTELPVPGSYELVTFTFTGVNRIALNNETYYVVVLQYDGGDSSNEIRIGTVSSGVHLGNSVAYRSSTGWERILFDTVFYVYKKTSLLDKFSLPDGTGFSGTLGGRPFDSGEQVTYTVQDAEPLAPDEYFWRVRAIDPLGSNTYGAWSTPTWSFTITAAGGPTLDQLMRHGKWFNSSGVRQPFTF